MKPFTKWTLEEHKRELEEIKKQNFALMEEIDKERMIHKDALKPLYEAKQKLAQKIRNKERYIRDLESV